MSVSNSRLSHSSPATTNAASDATSSAANRKSTLPLYVDLDGTLIYSDLLFESGLLLIKRNPLYIFRCLFWLTRGRSHLKFQIAQRVDLDVPLLPYNATILAYLEQQHAQGRRLVLASASDRTLVQSVADHLGLFDGVLGSDGECNLKSHAKLQAIRNDAGSCGFAYAGNSVADLAVWAHATEIIVVNASPLVAEQASKLKSPALIIPPRPFRWQLVGKALRLHQWVKNLLLFVPLLAAHDLTGERWLAAILAFIAFGMCASATYIVNDLFDLASDRAHPRKQARPFAAATLTIPSGFGLIAILLPLSLLLATWISLAFLAMMILYVVATLLYSARLKQVAIVDVLILASLYTHRILAGGLVAGVVVSNWLLAVSFFMFMSLALVKRCAELELRRKSGGIALAGRGYRTSDLSYLSAVGVTSGFFSVMLLALYVDSQVGHAMYPQARLLALILPLTLFWIMRLWLKVTRMEMHDDPLSFAITDRTSWTVAILIACVALAASSGSVS